MFKGQLVETLPTGGAAADYNKDRHDDSCDLFLDLQHKALLVHCIKCNSTNAPQLNTEAVMNYFW